jgi:hypothetical protein
MMVGALALAIGAGQARAQDPAERKPLFAPHQIAISAGFGAADFVRDRISDNSLFGAGWDARLLWGVRSPIAFEATYLGSAARADDPIKTTTVSTTQLFGAARLNLTFWRIQPFLTAGVGWANLHRNQSPAEAPIAAVTFAGNTSSPLIPFGGGMAVYSGTHGMVDARFNYQLITSKSFTDTGARPDMWVAELRAGYAF